MTLAKIKKLIKDRGFGFAQDDAGQQYFFHYSALDPKSGLKFEDLNEGQSITFMAADAEKGPRALPRTLNLMVESHV